MAPAITRHLPRGAVGWRGVGAGSYPSRFHARAPAADSAFGDCTDGRGRALDVEAAAVHPGRCTLRRHRPTLRVLQSQYRLELWHPPALGRLPASPLSLQTDLARASLDRGQAQKSRAAQSAADFRHGLRFAAGIHPRAQPAHSLLRTGQQQRLQSRFYRRQERPFQGRELLLLRFGSRSAHLGELAAPALRAGVDVGRSGAGAHRGRTARRAGFLPGTGDSRRGGRWLFGFYQRDHQLGYPRR